MSASSKKMLGIACGLLLIAAALGYFVGIPMWEKNQAEKITHFLQALPGGFKAESVTVSLLHKSATLRGVSGTAKEISGTDVPLKAEEVSLSGLNLSALTAKGASKLADALVLKGLTADSAVLGMKVHSTVQEATLSGIRGDIAALVEQSKQQAPREAILDTLSGFRIDTLALKGIAQDVESPEGPFTLTIAGVDAKNATLAGEGDYTITDSKMAFQPGDNVRMDFRTENVRISGMNYKALLEKKVNPLFAFFSIRGMTAVSTYPGMVQTITTKELVMRDARADMGTLVEQINSASPSLVDIFAVLKQSRIGELTVVGYAADYKAGILGQFGFTLETAKARDAGLLQCGETEWNGFSFSALNAEKLHIGSLSAKNVQLPDLFSPLLQAAESEEAQDQAFFAQLEREKLSIKGLLLKDLRITPDKDQAITLKSLGLDLEASTAGLSIKKDIEDFVVPPELYRYADPYAARFAETYGKPLEVSGASDIEITHANGKGDIHIKTLRLADKNLGSTSLTADLTFEGHPEATKFFDAPVETKLVKSNLTLQDSGLIAVLFDMAYKWGERHEDLKNGAELRARWAAELLATEKAYPTRELKNLIRATANFVRDSGTLTITATPPKPVSVQSLIMADSLPEGTLNIKSGYSAPTGVNAPAASPAQAAPAETPVPAPKGTAPAESAPAPAQAAPAAK